MLIGIVGAGALGHMLAHFLTRELPQQPIQMFGRHGPVPVDTSIVQHGRISPLRLEKREGDGSCSLLFILVKSYQLEAALAESIPRLEKKGIIVLLGNGYLEPLVAPWRERYPEKLWRKGIVTWGSRLDEQDRYVLSDRGEIQWAGTVPQTALERKVCEALKSYGVAWNERACELRRRKWFCNTVLNTICGAYRLPTNALALSMFAQDLKALGREVYDLGQELWPDWSISWDEAWSSLLSLIRGSESNENSMARDVRLGRRTEAEVLSGCIKLAKKAQRYPLLVGFDARLPH